MSLIHYFVLNMDKNPNRYANISAQLDRFKCNYTRVRGIDGFNMNEDPDAIELFKPYQSLIGEKLMNFQTKNGWIYDGSVVKSFPNATLNGNHGTKGLTLSNLKAFKESLTIQSEWVCILEDDAEFSGDAYVKINTFIRNPKNKIYDIVLLDNRANGWGGTCAMLYNKRIIPTLIKDLHPLSPFSIMSHKFGNANLGNLWDWKLWKYVMYINKRHAIMPCVKSGNFESTIDI